MNKRGFRLSAHVAQPAVAHNTGTSAIGSNPPRGAGDLPQSIAALISGSEEIAGALLHLVPGRPVTSEEVDLVVDFIVTTALEQAAPKAAAPLATAMVAMSAERFKDEVRARLLSKIGLRDVPAEGAA